MHPQNITSTSFESMNLSAPMMAALKDSGYTMPSPIQSMTIAPLLKGVDIIGQAQTGTGKTAAFAIPFLEMLDPKSKTPQVLTLTPTRELAIQVAKSFEKYASHMKNIKVLPIYGGQDYQVQFNGIKNGAQILVGTPGRVIDHLKRNTFSLNDLKALILDEADEMLRMGFIDDVEWILSKTPEQRQIALFSATMPTQIRRLAGKYLNKPEQIIIQQTSTAAETIEQKAWITDGTSKTEALERILEYTTDGVIVFVKTRNATLELSEHLRAAGFKAAALNGDMAQKQREFTVNQFKNARLDILIATDIAARGLDVQRISCVINYDAPFDTETYVHRIGRTGRAGKTGTSILFVTPRERRFLQAIEKTTKQRIEQIKLPTIEQINNTRIERFFTKINTVIEKENLSLYKKLLSDYCDKFDIEENQLSAALAHMLLDKESFFKKPSPQKSKAQRQKKEFDSEKTRSSRDLDMLLYRIEIGEDDKVSPGNIVGAIANEANLDSSQIGKISIFKNYSLIFLPKDLSSKTIKILNKVWVCNKQLNLNLIDEKRKKTIKKPNSLKISKKFKSKKKHAC